MPRAVSRSQVQEATAENQTWWVGRNHTERGKRARRSQSVAGLARKAVEQFRSWLARRRRRLKFALTRAGAGFTGGGEQSMSVNLEKRGDRRAQCCLCFDLCSRWPRTGLKRWTTPSAWPSCPNPYVSVTCPKPVAIIVVSAGGGGEHLPHTWKARTKPARCCSGFGGVRAGGGSVLLSSPPRRWVISRGAGRGRAGETLLRRSDTCWCRREKARFVFRTGWVSGFHHFVMTRVFKRGMQ